MIELSTLAEIIGQNENLTVTMTEDGLLISDVNEQQNVPADLINFVGIYEKSSNIVPKGNGYVITTETFTGQTFMMLLMSVYAAEYTFEVTGQYEVTVTKKGKEGVQEALALSEEKDKEGFKRGVSGAKNRKQTDLDRCDRKHQGGSDEHDDCREKAVKKFKSEVDKNKKLYMEESCVKDSIKFREDYKEIFGENFPETDFLVIAEAIDSSATEIEIHEDGLKITCANKSAIAEKIDSMNPTLNIEITNEFVLVSEGE